MARRPQAPGNGLSAIMLRRCCFAIVFVGSVLTVAYHPTLSVGLVAGLMLLVQGGLVSGAVQRVRREVRVGYAATVTGLATSTLLAVGLVVAPRRVGSLSKLVPREEVVPGQPNILAPKRVAVDVDAYNSPVLALFGRPATTHSSPSLAISIVLMFVAIAGTCLLWTMVARLGRERGVLDPHAGDGALTSGATLPQPLGTSVTRPAAPSRPNPTGRSDADDPSGSVGRPFPTKSAPLRLPPRLPGQRRNR